MKAKILLLAAAGFLLLFLAVPPFHDWLVSIFDLFRNPQVMREYIAGFGPLAPLISALLMIFQSVAAPLPAFLITFANGLLFGVWWGAALSWSSAMLGAALCFSIAR